MSKNPSPSDDDKLVTVKGDKVEMRIMGTIGAYEFSYPLACEYLKELEIAIKKIQKNEKSCLK